MGTRPMPAAHPPFSWSESRHRRFLECPRKHYLAVYQAHGGWLPSAQPAPRLAWTLSKLIPGWPVALGTAVHRCATICATTVARHEALPSFSALYLQASTELNYVYRCSRDRLEDFWRAPNHWPILDACFYGEPWRPAELQRTREALVVALQTLLDAQELWAVIRSAGVDGLWIPDRFFSFQLPQLDLHVYGAPDLVLRGNRTSPAEIWDFKLGRGDGVIDQMLVYALALQSAPQCGPSSDPTARYLGRVIHLGAGSPPDARAPFAMDDDDLAASINRIAASVSQMRVGVQDIAHNVPGSCDGFPQTARQTRCTRCQFRGLCHPETFPLGSRASSAGRTV